MRSVITKSNEWNYLKDDGTYLLDEHVYWCFDFRNGFGLIIYYDNTFNYVNSEGKLLLKNNVDNGGTFYTGLAEICINNFSYYVDKECNFYNENEISFKELYNKFPNKRLELIEIIEKYTYFDVNEYFNI